MLSSGSPGASGPPRSSIGQSVLFFKPRHLHLQPPDLLVEHCLLRLCLALLPAMVRKNLRQPLQRLLLPLRDLRRMQPEPHRQFVHRLASANRFHRYLRLEPSTVLSPRHRPLHWLGSDSANLTLSTGPNFGEHYKGKKKTLEKAR